MGAPPIMRWLARPSRSLSPSEAYHAAIAGCLLHGFYLGGVFWALSHGMQATLAALIISLQPVFTALLAGPLLGERITARNWLGILLGFVGALLVIGFDVGGTIPIPALLVCCGALLAAIAGTLYQKQFGQDMPLPPMNMVQAGAAMILHLVLLALFEVLDLIHHHLCAWHGLANWCGIIWRLCDVYDPIITRVITTNIISVVSDCPRGRCAGLAHIG